MQSIKKFYVMNTVPYPTKYLKFSTVGIRTSDSLNEELPIKMVREKFQRKCDFFHEKDGNFNSRIIRTSVFHIGQVPIKNMGRKHCFCYLTYRK